MNFQDTAAQILEQVGGPRNIQAMEHCSTRLRLTLADDSVVDPEAIKRIPGVLGVVLTGQTQIVIGNEVVEVYQALKKQVGDKADDGGVEPRQGAKRTWGTILLDFVVAVFQPLVPAIAGAGMLKSVLVLLASIGWVSSSGQTYQALTSISDATFYFLPLMVAVTTATKLNANRLVALAAVGVYLLPSFTKLLAAEGGFRLFGIPVQNVPYSGQVFPAILTVLLLALVEKWATRISPRPVRIFLVPMIALLVTVPIGLIALGPAGFFAGQAFTAAIVWVFEHIGWVATALLAALLPLIVSIGMHKAILPYALNQITTANNEALYLPASLAHNIAESGAMFGAALRTKDTTTRATAISAGVSALFGITEPALYGVTIQNRRALYSVMTGAAVAGAYMGLTMVKAFVVVGPGLASMSMFIDPTNPMNLAHAAIGAALAFIVAGLMTAFLWRDIVPPIEQTHVAADDETPGTIAPAAVTLLAPMPGEVVALSDVPDAVFAQGSLGDGVAIRPTSGLVLAPADGVVAATFPSNHAVALKLDSGPEVLIHVGLDTVKLDGKHFEGLVTKGQRVSAGEPLLRADLAAIEAAGYPTITPVVVLNSRKFDVSPRDVASVGNEDALLDVTAKPKAAASATTTNEEK